jgi:hypothetical protein
MTTKTVKIRLLHNASIPNARWCEPVDWEPTNIVEGREARVHKLPPSPNRWRERSRTFEGIAAAMAAQWGASDSASAALPEGKL